MALRERESVDTTALEGWHRVGELVRRARIELGYTNRENFAEACHVSVRVLSDIEAGTRTNFTGRVLAGLEEGLGWPVGTIDQLVADPNLAPPTPGGAADLVFRPPVFNRKPVLVDVTIIERSIAALTEAHRTWGKKPGAVETTVASAMVAQCWPYVTRLLEDNCLPGRELHPAVLPLYSAFVALSDWVAPHDPTRRYAQWLVGDSNVDEQTQKRFMQRWTESRKSVKGRRSAEAEAADDSFDTPF